MSAPGTPEPASSVEDPTETPNQRQARLRRERRNAKIVTGGSARLKKITDIHGGSVPEEDLKAAEALARKESNGDRGKSGGGGAAVAEDPEEVDIGTLRGGASGSRTQQQQRLASLFNDPSFGGEEVQAAGRAGINPNTVPGEEDPMMKMMKMMMGQMGDAGQANAGPGGEEDPMTKMMQAMMGGAAGGRGQMQDTPASQSDQAYLWRVVHALVAFAIAVYIAFGSTFNGSKISRSYADDLGREGGGVTSRLFYMFATAEVVLQSTRYFVEKGQLPRSGMLGMIAGLLPDPFAGYVRLIGRYNVIWTTVVSDAMVVVFVLGAMAWWKGEIMT